jgi:hypothetical protein
VEHEQDRREYEEYRFIERSGYWQERERGKPAKRLGDATIAGN